MRGLVTSPMHEEFDRHHRSLLGRRRWLRKLLRPLPRRANLRRYPVLKWFADHAKKAPFLWSFKRPQVLMSLYVGTVLAFMPLYGVQFVLAFAAAMLVRGNLTVMVGLQFITNPFTVVPIYGFTGWIGFQAMELLGLGAEMGRAMRVTHSLFIGAVVVGLAAALVADMFWRFASWEARVFKRRWLELRAARDQKHAELMAQYAEEAEAGPLASAEERRE